MAVSARQVPVRRRNAVWTDWLLREVAARATRGDVCRAVDTIERRPTRDRKELHAVIFANLLQASRIDGHRAVETEARSFQDDFERQRPLLRGRCRLVGLRDRLPGESRPAPFPPRRSRPSRSSGGVASAIHIRIRSGCADLGVVRCAIGKQASADRGVELVDRSGVDLVDRRGDGERTGAAKRRQRGGVDGSRDIPLEGEEESLKLKRLAEDRRSTLVVQQDEADQIGAGIHQQIERRLLRRVGVDGESLGGRGNRGETIEGDVRLRTGVGIDPVPALEIAKLLGLGGAGIGQQLFRQLRRESPGDTARRFAASTAEETNSRSCGPSAVSA